MAYENEKKREARCTRTHPPISWREATDNQLMNTVRMNHILTQEVYDREEDLRPGWHYIFVFVNIKLTFKPSPRRRYSPSAVSHTVTKHTGRPPSPPYLLTALDAIVVLLLLVRRRPLLLLLLPAAECLLLRR
jgi:hypothetical protein